MQGKPILMRHVREVLRLKASGASINLISRCVRIARSTIGEVMKRAAAAFADDWTAEAPGAERAVDRDMAALTFKIIADTILPGGDAFVAAAIEQTPTRLLEQLKDGGRLAAIVKSDGVFRGAVYRRSGGASAPVAFFDATTRFVLPEFQRPKAFEF